LYKKHNHALPKKNENIYNENKMIKINSNKRINNSLKLKSDKKLKNALSDIQNDLLNYSNIESQ